MADPVDQVGARIFAVPNAHIDPVWIWGWREGMREVIATFQAAAERLESDGELRFVASSAAYYAWVAELEPALFERIRALVAANRWEVVGGQWVEPDCLLPSGESVCRQLLYSQRFFAKHFGRIARVGYNIDSFGHAATLPQLFSKGGLHAYVMMRPQEHELPLPGSLFWWKGVDGTAIRTFRIVGSYASSGEDRDDPAGAEERSVSDRGHDALKRSDSEGTPMMLFIGVGDHGGGPTTAAINAVRQLAGEAPGLVHFATVSEFFGAAPTAGLPVVAGDLHMRAVGCYSVVAEVKDENIVSETALIEAELWTSLSEMASGAAPAAQTELAHAWQHVLFNQFHDSLCGTCSDEAYGSLRSFYGSARATADRLEAKATHTLARLADTWVAGAEHADRPRSADPYAARLPVPVVVFNPLSWPVQVLLELPHPAATVRAGSNELPVQSVGSREGTRYEHHAVTTVELPAAGFQLLWLSDGSGEDRPKPYQRDTAAVTGHGLSGGGLEVDVDEDAGVRQVRSTGRAWLTDAITPIVIDDPSDTWSHDVIGYDGREHRPTLRSVRVTEQGPLRATARLDYGWRSSTIFCDVSVLASCEEIDVTLRIDWHERHQVLKLAVPLALQAAELTAGLPYGAIARGASPSEQVLSGWLHLAEPSGAGVVCSSDVGCAYDLDAKQLRLTVLRSPRYADHGRPWTGDDVIDFPATDQGWREVTYRFRFHDAGIDAGLGPRQAAEQRATFPTVTETWHKGPLGDRWSGLTCEPQNVIVGTLKRAEDGSGWVIRLNETSGRSGGARLDLPAIDRHWEGAVYPYEVLTLLVPDDRKAPIREVLITEYDAPESGVAPMSSSFGPAPGTD